MGVNSELKKQIDRFCTLLQSPKELEAGDGFPGTEVFSSTGLAAGSALLGKRRLE
jgi:hypothetical protein